MREEDPGPSSFHMQRVFPDPPLPTPQDRQDDSEESLLGTFIQWVGANKKKQQMQRANTTASEKSKEDRPHIESKIAKDENKTAKDENRTAKDGNKTAKDENSAVNDEHKPIKNTDTAMTKRKKSNSARKRSKAHSGHHGDDVVKFTNNPAFKDVHLSRPSTPQPENIVTHGQRPDWRIDEYRIKYLTVRIEQQMEHVRRVLETMVAHDVDKFRISSMIKVKEALALLKSQLLGILSNTPSVMKMFSTQMDVEEFFGAVDAICSSIEEVPLEDQDQDKGLEHVMKMGLIGKNKNIKDGKTRVRKSKKSPPNTQDVKTLFAEGSQETDKTTSTNRNNSMNNSGARLLSRGTLKREKDKGSSSRETCSDDNGSSPIAQGDEAMGRKDIKPPRSSRSKSSSNTRATKTSPSLHNDEDNDVTTSYSDKERRRESRRRREVIRRVQDTDGADADNSAKARRALYKTARLQQSRGIYPCKEVFESWSDTDPEEEDLLADNGKSWPQLTPEEKELREKEEEYESLMDEIDMLMAQTKTTNKDAASGVSFENLMLGNTGSTKQLADNSKPDVTMTKLTPGAHVACSKNSTMKKHRKSDQFIDELDNLLSECEKVE